MKIGTILLIIVIALAIFALFMFLGYLGYNSPLPFNDWYLTVSGYIGNFDLKATLSDPGALLTGLGGAAAVAIPLFITYSGKLSSAKQQLTKVTSDSTGAIEKLTGDNKGLQEQISKLTEENQKLTQAASSTKNAVEQATTQGQTELLKLQGLNNTLTVQKSELQSNYDKLQIQYEELRKLVAVK